MNLMTSWPVIDLMINRVQYFRGRVSNFNQLEAGKQCSAFSPLIG